MAPSDSTPNTHTLDTCKPFQGDALLKRLREATSQQHDEVEHVPLLKRIGAEDYTLAEYETLLKRHYGFFKTYEAALSHWVKVMDLPRWSDRQRLPWLQHDLALLDVPADVQDALPTITQVLGEEMLDWKTPAQWAGAHYVVEGSSLGSQFIVKSLRSHFQWEDASDPPLAFYTTYGEETGAYWQEYRKFLGQFPQTEAQADEMVQAAQECFGRFTQWFSWQPE